MEENYHNTNSSSARGRALRRQDGHGHLAGQREGLATGPI